MIDYLNNINFKFTGINELPLIIEQIPTLNQSIKLPDKDIQLEKKLYKKYIKEDLNKLTEIIKDIYNLYKELGINYFSCYSIASNSLTIWLKSLNLKLRENIKPLKAAKWGKADFTKFKSFKDLLNYLNKNKKVAIIKAKITCISNHKLPFLKTRTDNDSPFPITYDENSFATVIPVEGDEWIDVYTFTDLEYASNLGNYEIEPIVGYSYKTSTKLFKPFVDNFIH